MQVVIDPRIEKDVELLDRVRRANSYLESQLGQFKDVVEATWATPTNRQDELEVTLRSTDDVQAEASERYSPEVLRPGGYTELWLRRVVDELLGRRVHVHLSRVQRMLKELDHEESANGV
jgi:hypothetical protein